MVFVLVIVSSGDPRHSHRFGFTLPLSSAAPSPVACCIVFRFQNGQAIDDREH